MHLLITGMARSGTTLLDKVLNAQKDIAVLSQPFPFLFRKAKTEFYKSIGHSETFYVLNNYFNEKHYRLPQLANYLKSLTLDKDEVQAVFNDMSSWSGQYTKVSNYDEILDFDTVNWSKLIESLTQKVLGERADAVCTGIKETQCEEFIPFLTEIGWKAIIIVRNPFDVISSIQFGKGGEFTGKKRPTLFHVRNWRKSVAFAAMLEKDPNVLVLKFDEVVAEPEVGVSKMEQFLGVPVMGDIEEKDLVGADGKPWKPNTSFSVRTSNSIFDASAVGRYKEVLPESMVKYVSYMCHHELAYLGFEKIASTEEDMLAFTEPFAIEAEGFTQDYSTTDSFIEERIRKQLLNREREPEADEVERLFINEVSFNALRS